jgi:ABC-2 type transport system permease protein
VDDLRLLAQLRWRVMVNSLSDLRRQSLLKLLVVPAAGIAFWYGIFEVSRVGFTFMNDFIGGAEVLNETLLSLFFLLLGVMLVFSNCIIAFGSFFRSEETALLLASPIEAESVLFYKLLESITFSSWAFLVLGFPLMMGYGLSVSAPWYYPALILIYFVPFVVLAATIGGAVALLVAAYLPGGAKRVLGGSVVAGLVVALSVTIWIHGAVRSDSSFLEAWVPRVLGRMNFARSIFLPSYWINKGLLRGASGHLGDAAYYWLVLTSHAALGLLVCWALGRRLLRVGWSRCRSKMGQRGRSPRCGWLRARWLPGMRLLMGKDWRLFLRDPVQWSQCAILFGLMGFYVLNLRTFSYHLARPLWRNLTALLNLAATSLVLATVTTRFVFPLLSLEGRRFWLLGLAPIRRGTILWSKFAFSFAGALLVTVPLVVVSDSMLKLPPATLWHHTLVIVLVCFGVSGLSVGLGAVFPNWREENPSKIVSGCGGTLNLLLSVVFVVTVILLAALPYGIKLARLGASGPETLYALALSGILSLLAGLLPMALGLRALRRLEL